MAAQVIGVSEAFSSVTSELQRHGLRVNSLDELDGLLAERLARRHTAEQDARMEHADARRQLECDLATAIANQRVAVETAACAHADRVTRLTNELASCDLEIDEAGSLIGCLLSWRRLVRYFAARRRKWRVKSSGEADIRQQLVSWRSAYRPIQLAQAALQNHDLRLNSFVSAKLVSIDREVEVLRRLVEEGGRAGAVAELEVIDALRRLPDGWTVINNVRIELKRWVRFNGKPLGSAQLDHVVVGPGGVFVIETKLWSQQFVESGEYFDPYEQVARASYLCHLLLKINGMPSRARSVIAAVGKVPERPEDSRTKVLHPSRLCGYIQWFKPELTTDEINSIVMLLSALSR